MKKYKKILVAVLIAMSVFSFGAYAVESNVDIAPVTEKDEASVSPYMDENAFSVDVDGEKVNYDFEVEETEDILSASDYVSNYADNLQNDSSFETHIKQALAKIRESIRTYATFWSLVPPIIAIVLALITKQVYSSLFLGILAGGVIYSGANFETLMVHVFKDGFIDTVADSYNIGIIIFFCVIISSPPNYIIQFY